MCMKCYYHLRNLNMSEFSFTFDVCARPISGISKPLQNYRSSLTPQRTNLYAKLPFIVIISRIWMCVSLDASPFTFLSVRVTSQYSDFQFSRCWHLCQVGPDLKLYVIEKYQTHSYLYRSYWALILILELVMKTISILSLIKHDIWFK